MKFDGSIVFEGGNGLRWIKKNKETGLIEMVLATDGRGEIVLYFEPELLKSIAENAQKFFAGDEKVVVDGPDSGSCRIKPNLVLLVEDEDVSIEVDWDQPNESDPMIIISGKRWGKVDLGFNLNQARVISECCKKVIEIRNSLEELQKSKLVSAQAESV